MTMLTGWKKPRTHSGQGDGSSDKRDKYLGEVMKRLLLGRRWRYLRYLHLREGFLFAKGVESVLSIGSGHGYSELALALEFPHVHFHLTDIETDKSPYYGPTQNLVKTWGVNNVTFGVHDILKPTTQRFDLVTSIEVLEHIENDSLAAAQMRAAANRYVFVLVPFGDKAANADAKLRQRVMENHEHFRVGYDAEDLRALFPSVVTIRGCYWKGRGQEFRKRLYDMTDDQVRDSIEDLQGEALGDIDTFIPTVYPEAQGIWMVARA